MFHRIQTKQSTKKILYWWKTQKQEKKQEKLTLRVCLILPKCTGSTNCTHAGKVTSNINRAPFRFLKMLEETRFCIKSSLFRRVSVEAAIENKDNLVLLTGLIMWIGHRKEIRNLTFRTLDLRRIDSLWEGLTIETSALNLFTVANSHYQPSW